MPSSTPSRTPTATPGPTPNPATFADTVIYHTYHYTNLEDGPSAAELWSVRADGTSSQMIFDTGQVPGEWYPAVASLQLSHSGEMLVFIHYLSTRAVMSFTSSLWVMNSDGSDLRELAGGYETDLHSPDWETGPVEFWLKERPVDPAWSPDDSMIAFSDNLGLEVAEPGIVCILNVESGRWWEVGEGELVGWSPEGDALVVYSSARLAASNDLRVLELDGSTRTTMDWSARPTLRSLEWSSRNRLILAQTIAGTVLTIDLEREQAEAVIYHGHNNRGYPPRWSPDGEMISFVRTEKDVENLYILDMASREERLVMPKIGSDAVWSPDSKLILVYSDAKGSGWYVVSVANGQYYKIPHPVDNDKRTGGSLGWSFPSR